MSIPKSAASLSHAPRSFGAIAGTGLCAMLRLRIPLLLCAFATLSGIAACNRGEKAGEGVQVAGEGSQEAAGDAGEQKTEEGWEHAAMQTVEQLVAKVRAAGVPCDELEPGVAGMLAANQLPLPAAVASCTSEDEEDLTFEVFQDAERAREFVTMKQNLLCQRAKSLNLPDFPGFPYIDGGAWIVEPDEKGTAEKLAPLVGGTAHLASCEKQ
jgi:predicted small secreted protein